MNAEQLLQYYEQIADAPDAVARLRRFILDLAVRGKLYEQNVKEPKPSWSHAEPSNSPYDLPMNWRWVTIGEQLDLLNGMAFKPTDWSPTGLRIVRIQNLNNPSAAFNFCKPSFARQISLIDDGAFLISWSGTPGTSFGAFIWGRGPAVLNQHIFRCDFKTEAFFDRFLRLAINGRLDEMIAKAHGGVGLQHITKGKLEALAIALPPLAEQRRIVVKVDELMALCDRLESARSERETTRDRLTAASLARLNKPDPDPAVLAGHARFAIDNLAALTTRPDQIKQLRQTILNLAVRGKLVPQDPSDEPASELLERIAKDKSKSLAAQDELNPDREHPLPPGWCLASLAQLVTDGPRNGISPRATKRQDAPKAITLTATTSGVFRADQFKHVEGNFPPDSPFWLVPGDLLFQRGNTSEYVGMAAIYDGAGCDFLFPDLIIKVRVSERVDLRFVHMASVSPPSREYLSKNASGAQATMPKINQSTLLSLPLPVPSLAEQRRIVAKVDQLMVLCDRLEASLTECATTRRRLLDALVAEALAPVDKNQREAAQ